MNYHELEIIIDEVSEKEIISNSFYELFKSFYAKYQIFNGYKFYFLGGFLFIFIS